MDLDGKMLAGSQKGVTLIELMVAMLLVVMVSSMLYSVLNVGIKFSGKGEARLADIGRQRAFLDLFHRQMHGVRYDIFQKKLMIEDKGDLLKMVTSAPLINRYAGLVLAIYLYDPREGVLYYDEKLDFYNSDYGENYSPLPAEMIVLLRDLDEIAWQYDDTTGVLAVSYLGQDYEMALRSWRPDDGS